MWEGGFLRFHNCLNHIFWQPLLEHFGGGEHVEALPPVPCHDVLLEEAEVRTRVNRDLIYSDTDLD